MIDLKRIAKEKITVSQDTVEFIENLAKHSLESETGGIIGGKGIIESSPVIITHASDGGPKATRAAFYFSRDTEYCQNIVDTWAISSGGEVDYLGEWHKHLERNPTPSPKDILTMKHIAASPQYHVTIPILVIIGNSNSRKAIRIFLVDSDGAVQEAKWKMR